MAVFQATFRFVGTPPSRDQVHQALRALGCGGLTGYRAEGTQVVILTSFDAFTPAYTLKVLRDLGGSQIDDTGALVEEALPDFVSKPWFAHDDATREAIIAQFEESCR